jgi:hypothetical protein
VTKPNPVPEREFQKTLVSVLEVFGYEVNHTFPLRTQHGWRTGTTAVGWPDLLAIRVPRMLAIEVKGAHTPLEEAQRAWLSMLSEIPCVRAWVIRPTDPDWADVQAWIRYPKDAPRTYGFEPLDEPRKTLAAVKADRAQRRASRREPPPFGTPTLPLSD